MHRWRRYHERRRIPSLAIAAFCSVVSACQADGAIYAEPAPGSGALAFDCGTIRPGLEVTCNRTGDPQDQRSSVSRVDPVALQPGLGFSAIIGQTRDECGAPLGAGAAQDPDWARIDEAAASLAARCDASAADGAMEATIRLVGAGSQFCHRSSSLVAPSWQGTLSVPAGVHRIRVTSEAELDLERWGDPDSASCVAYVDGEPADPIFGGRGRIATRYVSGPANVAVTLDCPRLAGRSCYDVANEEGTTRRYVGLTYRVERVE